MNEERNFPNLNGEAAVANENRAAVARTRHQERLDALPAAYKTNVERMALELALKIDEPLDVFARYGYDIEQAVAIISDPAFARLFAKTAQDVRENGLSYRAKARAMAEDLLPQAFSIATDEMASQSVRADMIQWITRVADLEPVRMKDGSIPGGGGGLVLNMHFAGEAPKTVSVHEPITIEGEK